ncbi:MAG: MbcA/ParS/Xre antitoxin family protein [Sphingopyxis granuli]|uniref:MbcA/ParS/Xre antitoxin family protein n=1 Tax=Sphingopyxis granuli TaxID=267128 RepID=UPI003C75D15C
MERKDEMMPTTTEAQGRVLSEAVARVSALWGIGDDLLAEILGVSASHAADLRSGTFQLARSDPGFRAGQCLVRLYEELGALIGDDRSVMAWLQAENLDLGGRPIDLVRTDRGLREILSYVETRLAPS